ncbi:glycerophosphodiester phosphodiesterase family protein [Variovorax sp. HJSM1_2]|uniref:glycerophosphodiester phosphodiesterase family protein n=1 Tax=Variovorax sp. HJSM1_2 TaxID=3366263 RepID=UPI003BF4BD69
MALIALLAAAGLTACGGGSETNNNTNYVSTQPLVIAHRGASGYLPEHTLGGYELAVRLGADFIEPDLQLSKDGALVAIHDDTLERTTNVATLFAKRNNAYKVADFTLAEIKTLTVQPTGTGKTSYSGFTPSSVSPWTVPTFEEVLDLVERLSRQNTRVGVYPEAKQADPAMEDAILSTLIKYQYSSTSKLFVQSFSDATLRSMRTKSLAKGTQFPQILLGAAVMGSDNVARVAVITGATPTLLTLQEAAQFVAGIGLVINVSTYPITKAYIDQAHAAGLKVHGWTFAQADATLAAAEYKKYLDMGMDGMFSNYTDLAVTARDTFVKTK